MLVATLGAMQLTIKHLNLTLDVAVDVLVVLDVAVQDRYVFFKFLD